MNNPVMPESSRPDLRAYAFTRVNPRRPVSRLSAIQSKLVAREESQRNQYRPPSPPDANLLTEISLASAMDARDVENLYQLLPETELTEMILISSILSPKDMVQCELHYRIEGDRYTSELTGQLLDVIREYFTNEHKIEESLETILSESLFTKGSCPFAILPESSIDQAINSHCRVGMESIRDGWDTINGRLKTIGLLGDPVSRAEEKGRLRAQNQSLEHWMGNTQKPYTQVTTPLKGLTIIDNYDALKIPAFKRRVQEDRVNTLLRKPRVSHESRNEASRYYPARQFANTPIVTITQKAGRKNVGHPMVMKLPHESVIPIHTPGTPEDHIAYIVMLDGNGHPLSMTDHYDQFRQMGFSLKNMGSDQQAVSNEIQQAYLQSFGSQCGGAISRVEELQRVYTDIVEHQIRQRLANGVYGSDVELGSDPVVYRMMLARALSRKQTQMLLIPKELLVYFAFDYNQYGVGRSLMSKAKFIASLRVILRLAETKAGIKNSVGHSKMRITLDERDPNPDATIEAILHEHVRVTNGLFPAGVTEASDLLDYLHRASYSVEIEGNPAYPNTKVDIDDHQVSRAKPDTDLTEDLRKAHAQSLWVTPEMIDNASGPDFATTVTQNNLLFSKRVIRAQATFCNHLTRYIATYVFNSETLMEALRNVIKNNLSQLSADEREAQAEGEIQREKIVQKQQDQSSDAMYESDIEPTDESEADEETDEARAEDQTQDSEVDDASETSDETSTDDGDATTDAEEKPKVEPRDAKEALTSRERYLREKAIFLDSQIREGGYDSVIEDFLTSLRVELPAPDTLAMSQQVQAFDAYKQGLETALSAYISEEFLSREVLGDTTSEMVKPVVESVKAMYLRDYLRKNNMFPELESLTEWSEENGPALNMLEMERSRAENINRSLGEYARAVIAFNEKMEAEKQAIQDDWGSGGSDSSSYDSGSDDSGGDDFGDDEGGFDDGEGGDDFDMGGDESDGEGESDDSATDDSETTDEDASGDTSDTGDNATEEPEENV